MFVIAHRWDQTHKNVVQTKGSHSSIVNYTKTQMLTVHTLIWHILNRLK